MLIPIQLTVEYPDKFRFWQDVIVSAEQNGGRIFLPTDWAVEPGQNIQIEVLVADAERAITFTALVEARRPPSLRFSRGIYVRITPGEIRNLQRAIGLLPVPDAAASARHTKRYELRWPVAFRTPALPRLLVTEDLSAVGMHVQLPERVRPGHVVEFSLHTSQGHELGFAGTVVWSSEIDHSAGIRFLFSHEEAAELFRQLVEEAVRVEQPPEVRRTQTHTLLIADDDEFTRRLMVDAFDSSRFRIVTAATGEEALALIRVERPDVVLLDILMPRLDGLTVCRTIRADAELCDLPVILVSAPESTDLAFRADDAGASDYLTKPFSRAELVQLVEAYIRLRAD